jgi:hypothetical protein
MISHSCSAARFSENPSRARNMGSWGVCSHTLPGSRSRMSQARMELCTGVLRTLSARTYHPPVWIVARANQIGPGAGQMTENGTMLQDRPHLLLRRVHPALGPDQDR